MALQMRQAVNDMTKIQDDRERDGTVCVYGA